MFEISRSSPAQSVGSEKPLQVARFRISPKFKEKGFTYYKGDLLYEVDYYHEFHISPAAMITTEVRDWFSNSGRFKYVTDGSEPNQAFYVLEGLITALFGDFSLQTKGMAVLEIEFTLAQVESGQSRFVLQKRYRETVPLKKTSAEALVWGWNKALRHILTAFEGDLATLPL